MTAAHVAAIHLCSRDLESLHFSIQPFGAPAAPAGLGPPRVLMLMLMVIVVVVRSHTLGRYCFLLHQLASRSALALHQPEENRWEPPTPDPIAVLFYQSLAPPATRRHP